MLKSALFFSFAFFAISCFAQEFSPETDCDKIKDLHFESKIGLLYLDFDKLNHALAENSVAIFEDEAMHQRFAIRTRNKAKGSSLIGFEIIYGMDRDAYGFDFDNQTRNVRNFTGYGIFSEYDYYILRKKAVDFYPSFGIGFNRSSLKITDNIPAGINFSNSIHSTAITRKYSTWEGFADAELNLRFKFYILGALYHIGTYGGYRADILDSEWKMDENVPIDFPKLTMSGWQWGFIVGAELDCERRKKYLLKKKEKKG